MWAVAFIAFLVSLAVGYVAFKLMTAEPFETTIQFWTNLELIRYETKNKEKTKALNNEIVYRIRNNIHR